MNFGENPKSLSHSWAEIFTSKGAGWVQKERNSWSFGANISAQGWGRDLGFSPKFIIFQTLTSCQKSTLYYKNKIWHNSCLCSFQRLYTTIQDPTPQFYSCLKPQQGSDLAIQVRTPLWTQKTRAQFRNCNRWCVHWGGPCASCTCPGGTFSVLLDRAARGAWT